MKTIRYFLNDKKYNQEELAAVCFELYEVEGERLHEEMNEASIVWTPEAEEICQRLSFRGVLTFVISDSPDES